MRFHPTILLVLLCAAPAAAQSGRPDVPQVDPDLARIVPASPVPAGFIADVPDVIPPDVESALNSRIAAGQVAGRGDIGVAVLPSLEGRTPAEVGVAIYRVWRIGRIDSIGSARRNLGVLLLIVPKELAPDNRGHCWITTGRGAEGIVTDAASARICRERVVPQLVNRDYGAAVAAALDGLEARLASDEGLAAEPFSPESDGGGSGFRWWLVPAGLGTFIAGLFGITRWRRVRPRRCVECGHPMRRAGEREDDASLAEGQRLEERLKSVDYDVWRCERGHELVIPYKSHFTSYKACPNCGYRTVGTKRRTVRKATYSNTGTAEDTHTCKSCQHRWVEAIVLPMLVRSASSSSGGGGGGGGGGGSSFGGSGSTGGGGGGSSY